MMGNRENNTQLHEKRSEAQTDRNCVAGQDAEERYRTLLAVLRDFMFRIRRDGTFVEMHAPDPSRLWRPAEEFLGKRIEEAFPGEFSRVWMSFIEKTLAEGGTHAFDYHGWGEHAHQSWEARLTACGPDEVLALTREVTDRKAADEELLKHERYLQSIFDAAIDPLWDWDVANDRTVFSPTWARIIGCEPHEYDPDVHTLESVLHPEDEPRVRAALDRCLCGDAEEYEAEYRVRHRSGNWRWVYSHGQVIERDEQGQPLRMVGSLRDMTARRHAEEEVRLSEERQRVLLRELDHRVRNNLASLMALIDISSSRAQDVKELASSIRSRVQAMSVAHGLLTRSHLSPLDLRRLITALIPPEMIYCVNLCGPEVFVSARQSTALGMVVQELITNSAKHGSLKAMRGRVEVSWSVRGEAGPREPVEVELMWRESGGPPASEPAQPGVGTTLINGLIQAELQGSAELVYSESGAHHRLVLRLDSAEGDPFRR